MFFNICTSIHKARISQYISNLTKTFIFEYFSHEKPEMR